MSAAAAGRARPSASTTLASATPPKIPAAPKRKRFIGKPPAVAKPAAVSPALRPVSPTDPHVRPGDVQKTSQSSTQQQEAAITEFAGRDIRGSQQAALMAKAQQSIAGRVHI